MPEQPIPSTPERLAALTFLIEALFGSGAADPLQAPIVFIRMDVTEDGQWLVLMKGTGRSNRTVNIPASLSGAVRFTVEQAKGDPFNVSHTLLSAPPPKPKVDGAAILDQLLNNPTEQENTQDDQPYEPLRKPSRRSSRGGYGFQPPI